MTSLTKREREVAALVCEGYSNKVIADVMNISVETVKRHMTNMFDKVGCHSRIQLAMTLIRPALINQGR